MREDGKTAKPAGVCREWVAAEVALQSKDERLAWRIPPESWLPTSPFSTRVVEIGGSQS